VNSLNNDIVNAKLEPAPPGLILASLLVWGWQTPYMLYAIIIGLLLELPLFIKWRIDFSDKDINQLADLSGVIFFIITVYVFVNYSFEGIYKILELLPFALLLLMLVQNYGIQNGIKTSALFISIRRLGKNAGPDILYSTNIGMPYVFICLISASSGNKYSDYFFIACAVIIAWLLLTQRTRHFSKITWFCSIVFVCFFSYLTQNGLQQLQNNSEAFFLSLFEQYGWRSTDPERTSTSIGSLGRLKLSDRIIFRVKADKPSPIPLYFRETSYSIYEYGSWRNPKVEFDIIGKSPGKNEWRLNKNSFDKETMDVSIYLQDQAAIIPVPDNINTLAGKDLIQIETSVYGSTRIEAREGWINYRLGVSDHDFVEAIPAPEDLDIPLNYKTDFEQIAIKLDLYSKTQQEIINTVKQYFKDDFYYSITQNQRYTKGQYLTRFLFKDKKGHCEYFATATALLLREAGIPTRYTIGYSVQEYSNWQGSYLVRARHAHAWLKYYIDGAWHNMDTTPSVWAPMEAEDRTILEPLMDLFSWLRYKTTGSDIDSKKEQSSDWMLWLLFPLGAYLAWRFYTKQRVEQKNKLDNISPEFERFGTDSPLYPIIAQLEQEADTRKTGETLSKWIKRILSETRAEQYLELIKLHNHYRFNPAGDKIHDKQIIKKSLDSLS
jgi:protein-glutamine gamma-glutamyltransferase